jgi:hypothetical protein
LRDVPPAIEWQPLPAIPLRANFDRSTRTCSASGKKSACVTSTDGIDGIDGVALHGAVVDKVDIIGSAWVPPATAGSTTKPRAKLLTDIDQLCNEASHLRNGTYQDL